MEQPIGLQLSMENH